VHVAVHVQVHVAVHVQVHVAVHVHVQVAVHVHVQILTHRLMYEYVKIYVFFMCSCSSERRPRKIAHGL
jgi:hypothetical protein